ncbi:hypothetical protein GBZ26_00595 [Azospirillum formosense]|uniref:Uncharacterized protein n=1 Tax=Azospirillum formosense TaxID=861533 RepID=A0ABX2KM50_9PROT|nr:hypothetical protein [Azospirillum formosense]MBY3752994.1 hypothetical protein [Azospirillum formosense]NUB17723.1 hypothetical protein [Azospirillum formosense]
MADITTNGLAFASFMLSAKILETLQAKGLLTNEETVQTIKNAHEQLLKNDNQLSLEAADALAHFFAGPTDGR